MPRKNAAFASVRYDSYSHKYRLYIAEVWIASEGDRCSGSIGGYEKIWTWKIMKYVATKTNAKAKVLKTGKIEQSSTNKSYVSPDFEITSREG